mgnify:CR=1 FL=1
MKKILSLFFIITCVTILNTGAHADWSHVATSVSEDKYYVDFKRIRGNSSGKYFWYLTNYKEVDRFGDRSNVTYSLVECGALKYKWLVVTYYASGMGKGKENDHDPRETEWKYPTRGSVMERVLNRVCDY